MNIIKMNYFKNKTLNYKLIIALKKTIKNDTL